MCEVLKAPEHQSTCQSNQASVSSERRGRERESGVIEHSAAVFVRDV